MILTLDIGNTNISIGLFDKNRLILTSKFPTKNFKRLSGHLKGLLKKSRNPLDAAVICSVVPRITEAVKKETACAARLKKQGIPIYITGKNLKIPICNRYSKPEEVGQDRLINAYAAINFYGSPAIIMDSGTAITFDIVSKKREYLGGMILPGLGLSLESLHHRTALLPKIEISLPKGLIGCDTKSSMLNGVILGASCICDGFSRMIKAQIGKNAKVIATGGNIELIAKHCKSIDKVDPFLTLKGLNLLYQNPTSEVR